MSPRSWVAALLLSVTTSAVQSPTSLHAQQPAAAAAPAAGATFSSVQGAYIIKFARYATWMKVNAALPNGKFVIGIVGADPFGNLFNKRAVNKQAIQIEHFKDPENIGPCHVLYVNLEKKADIAKCLAQLKSAGVLTVSDHPAFMDAGGMIRFVVVTNKDGEAKVRYTVNANIASTAGIDLGTSIQQFALNAEDLK